MLQGLVQGKESPKLAVDRDKGEKVSGPFVANRYLSPVFANSTDCNSDDEAPPYRLQDREVFLLLQKAKRQPEKVSDLLKVTQSSRSGEVPAHAS